VLVRARFLSFEACEIKMQKLLMDSAFYIGSIGGYRGKTVSVLHSDWIRFIFGIQGRQSFA
jgi:hypothetical protein